MAFTSQQSHTSLQLLNILSSVFSLAISCLESTDHNYGPDLFSLLGKLKTCVSLICQIDLNDLYTCKSSMLSENWRHFPIPSSWQSDENTIIKLRELGIKKITIIKGQLGSTIREFDS